MTSQCPRCLSSSFKLLSNDRCTFCVGHFKAKHETAKHETANGRHDRSLHTYQIVMKHYIDEPTVLNGRDRTTSGVIGQP